MSAENSFIKDPCYDLKESPMSPLPHIPQYWTGVIGNLCDDVTYRCNNTTKWCILIILCVMFITTIGIESTKFSCVIYIRDVNTELCPKLIVCIMELTFIAMGFISLIIIVVLHIIEHYRVSKNETNTAALMLDTEISGFIHSTDV